MKDETYMDMIGNSPYHTCSTDHHSFVIMRHYFALSASIQPLELGMFCGICVLPESNIEKTCIFLSAGSGTVNWGPKNMTTSASKFVFKKLNKNDWQMIPSLLFQEGYTPENEHGTQKNHPIEKEHHFPNLHFWVPNVNFPGCIRLDYPEKVEFLKFLRKGAMLSSQGVTSSTAMQGLRFHPFWVLTRCGWHVGRYSGTKWF